MENTIGNRVQECSRSEERGMRVGYSEQKPKITICKQIQTLNASGMGERWGAFNFEYRRPSLILIAFKIKKRGAFNKLKFETITEDKGNIVPYSLFFLRQ